MSAITSQITSLTIVYSIVYSDADQRKHQSSASLAFMWGIHRGLMNSPYKWPVTRKMFPFHDFIMKLPGDTTLSCRDINSSCWNKNSPIWAKSRPNISFIDHRFRYGTFKIIPPSPWNFILWKANSPIKVKHAKHMSHFICEINLSLWTS